MKITETIAGYAELRRGFAADGRRVAYVATMGALHAGHLSLLALARQHADIVVVSVFVNPLQFGPAEDYSRYPRPRDADLELCREAGVDVVFIPSVTEIYPPGRQVTVSAGPLGAILEGETRAGHFDGVLTVVLKLFHILDPHVAIFGQKDAQQLACIRRMVLDLNLSIEIIGAPTIRESDGLAMSSRNRYLNAAEQRLALSLSTALQAAAAASTVPQARAAAYAVLDEAATNPAFRLDYATLVDPATFAELADNYTGSGLLVLAAFVGETRLIDNGPVELTGP